MRVRSIGWQTDLRLRQLEGAEIIERDDHLIVRSAQNPTYRWGNFLLFDSPPRKGHAERWLKQFELSFPQAEYLALGFDSPSGALGEIAELRAVGMQVEIQTVMTTSGRLRASREPPEAVFREVRSDEDWRLAIELRLANDAPQEGPGFADFVERQMQAIRDACEQGHGAWFGAFRDDQLQAGLGIFNAGAGMARFQSVDTHPAHRRQGLASNLLIAASQYALTQFAASTLVIAADPDYLAIEIYRSLGFRDREHHVQLERITV
jgi:GNAT superfamily N-acetyltransferase